MTAPRKGPTRIGCGPWTDTQWCEYLTYGPDPLVELMRARLDHGIAIEPFWQGEIDSTYWPSDSEIVARWLRHRVEVMAEFMPRFEGDKPWGQQFKPNLD